MKKFLLFTFLLVFLIIVNSCMSNEELDAFEKVIKTPRNHIQNLDKTIKQSKFIFNEIDSVSQVINQLKNNFTNRHKREINSFDDTINLIKTTLEEDDYNPIAFDSVLEVLLEELNDFMVDKKIFEDDIIISSDADYTSFVENQYEIILGHLTIRNTNIQNLTGLESLTSVGGLSLHNNPLLVSTEGIDNLVKIDSYLMIKDNPLLKEITPLKLKEIQGSLFLRRNPLLEDLEGLKNLKTIGKMVLINDIDSLTSLEGLKNLTSVGTLFVISENDSLKDLNGLDNLVSIGESLEISNNDALTNLKGLVKLLLIGESLEISLNDNLSSFDGVQKLFENDNFKGSYSCWGNAFNPTKDDLVNGVYGF